MFLKMLFSVVAGFTVTSALATSFGEILILPETSIPILSVEELEEEVQALRADREFCTENHLNSLRLSIQTHINDRHLNKAEAKELSTKLQKVIEDCQKAGLLRKDF